MKIAVLSGKGGTGKTTVSASLAASIDQCQYIDCDVEEPNGALFLKPEIKNTTPVCVLVPQVDMNECDGCGKCGEACQFNAIAVVKTKVLIFPEICHHCGACMIACPHGAITEIERDIGVVESDSEGYFFQGKLNIGEPIAIPIISELKKLMRDDIPVVLDSSPGASCTVVATIEDCDYCILVTEPTPFGLHDLIIAVQLVRKMDIPFGVIINKAMEHDKSIHEYCEKEKIDVLMEIPFLREIAESYSKGILPVQSSDELKNKFRQLYEIIKGGAAS